MNSCNHHFSFTHDFVVLKQGELCFLFKKNKLFLSLRWEKKFNCLISIAMKLTYMIYQNDQYEFKQAKVKNEYIFD